METTIQPDNKDQKQNILLWIFVIIAFGAGYAIGASITKRADQTKIHELQQVVDAVYPPPKGEIKAASGIISSMQNSTLDIDIPSLTQTYPKPGETLPRQHITVALTKDTIITELLLDPKAKPKTITKEKLATGDMVYVTVTDNLLKTSETQALSVQKNIYPTATTVPPKK